MATKYLAPFSFGDVKRTTKYRTYSHAWAIFPKPESTKPITGFSGSAHLAQQQISSHRSYGCTGPSEVVACREVTK